MNLLIDDMTPEKWREITANGEDPVEYLTPQNWQILVSKGIDPLGYLSPQEWQRRALRNVDPQRFARFFSDIDTVDWTQLHHASGVASDIPDMLRSILSDDDLAAGVAWNNLFASLSHQGDVYSATVEVLPFLIRLIHSDDHRHREYILDFLELMLRVTSEQSAYESRTLDAIRTSLAQQGRDLDEEMRLEQAWKHTIHTNLLKYVPQIRDMLNDPDEIVRQSAQIFLSTLEEIE